MFCPPNYARIEEICSILWTNLRAEVPQPEATSPVDWVSELIRIQAKDTWIFLNSCPSLSIVSPQGVVLRIGHIALSAIFVAVDGHKAEISTGHFYPFTTSYTEEDFLQFPKDVWPNGQPSYLALSPDWIVEDLKRIKNKIAHFSDSLENYLHFQAIGAAIVAEVFDNAKKMAPFAGWSLCILEADLPKSRVAAGSDEPNLATVILGIADSKKSHLQIKAETMKIRPNLSHKDFDRGFEIARRMHPDKFLTRGRPRRNYR